MNKWFKILSFFLLAAVFMAAVGGTAYLFYYGKGLFGVCNIVLAFFAWPSFKEVFDDFLK